MKESGCYPLGAENDPKAPYNQSDDDICPICNDNMELFDFGKDWTHYICRNCGHSVSNEPN